jgi:hypothetical protein
MAMGKIKVRLETLLISLPLLFLSIHDKKSTHTNLMYPL